MKKITVLLSLIATISLVTATSCWAADTIKFLVVGPMTMDSAAQGIQMKIGTQIAVDEINAKGGINGKKLEFEVADDASNPNQASMIAQKYAGNKDLLFVLGHINTGCSLASLPTFSKVGIPVISPANTGVGITRLGYKNYFRVITNDDIMTKQLVKVAVSLGMKRPALVWENSDYGTGLKDIAVKEMPKYKVKIVADESFTPGIDRDYSAIVTKFKGLKADGVLILGDYTSGGLFSKQAYNLGYKPILVGTSSCSHQKLIELGGKGAENFYVTCPMDPNDKRPKQAEFISKFVKASKGDHPGEWSSHAYDIVYMVKAAYENGGTDRAKLIKALHDLKGFEGVTGKIDFDQYGDVPDKTVTLIKVKNGEFVSASNELK